MSKDKFNELLTVAKRRLDSMDKYNGEKSRNLLMIKSALESGILDDSEDCLVEAFVMLDDLIAMVHGIDYEVARGN